MQMRASLPLGQTRERRWLGRRRESALLGCCLKETPVIHGAFNYHFKTDKFKQNQTCYSQSEILFWKVKNEWTRMSWAETCWKWREARTTAIVQNFNIKTFMGHVTCSSDSKVAFLPASLSRNLEHDSVYSLHNYLLTTDKYWHFQQSYTCFGQSAVFCLNGEEFGLAWRHISWSDRRRMSLHRYKRFNLSASIYEFFKNF